MPNGCLNGSNVLLTHYVSASSNCRPQCTVCFIRDCPSGVPCLSHISPILPPPPSSLQVSYSFAPGSEEDRMFSIEPITGKISTRVKFDREDQSRESPFYTIVVIAKDGAPSDIRLTSEPNQGKREVASPPRPPRVTRVEVYRRGGEVKGLLRVYWFLSLCEW